MKRMFVCAATLLLAGANGTRAEETLGSPTNPHPLPDTIVVSANRVPTSVDKVANTVTIITRQQIEQSQAIFVAHLLRSVPAVDVVESGGPGKSGSVFLRGTGSQHVLVIRDGVRMNDPSSPNGSYDFGTLTTDGVERIEILRGSQSVLYGSDAIGGVIEIFTRRGSGRPSISVSSETGSFNSFHQRAAIGAGNNTTDFSLTFSHKSSDGFSASDTKLGGREKDGYRNTGITGVLGIALPANMEISFSGTMNDSKTDVDQSWGALDDSNATNAATTRTLTAVLNRTGFQSRWTPQLRVTHLRQEFESEDRTDSDHPYDAGTFNSRGRRLTVSTQHSIAWSEHVLLFGGDWEQEKYESDMTSQSFWGTYTDSVTMTEIQTVGAFLSNNWAVSDAGVITGGVRLDHHEEFGDHLTYRIAGAFREANTGVKARISFSTGFKAPTLFQLYHPLYGNRDLSPERGVSREIGFEKSTDDGAGKIEFTYFQIQLSDLFSYDPTTFRTVNIGKASTEGVEFGGEYAVGPFSARASYTFTETKDESTHSLILRRPRHKVSGSLSAQLGKRLRSTLDVRYAGTRHDIDFTSFTSRPVVLESYVLTDLSASLVLMPRIELRARVHNLFDKSYQDVYSYGTSRRAIYAGVTASL